jgi:hypothetical protein
LEALSRIRAMLLPNTRRVLHMEDFGALTAALNDAMGQ